jgi:glutamate/tyrosine decarboxylase-like PLP-dependent enzyme
MGGAGMVSELVTAALNTNLHIYNVAPALTLCVAPTSAAPLRRLTRAPGRGGGRAVAGRMELYTVEQLGRLFGYTRAEGVTCPGGSYAILLAMVTARNTLVPEAKAAGMHAVGAPLAVFTSAEAHYSVSKNAMLMGVGLDHVIKVATDDGGRMRPDDLGAATACARGTRPLY